MVRRSIAGVGFLALAVTLPTLIVAAVDHGLRLVGGGDQRRQRHGEREETDTRDGTTHHGTLSPARSDLQAGFARKVGEVTTSDRGVEGALWGERFAPAMGSAPG